MSKFKVGDTPTIRKDLHIDIECYSGIVDVMLEFKGMKVTIDKIDECTDPDGHIHYHIKEDNGKWCWNDEMFEDKLISDYKKEYTYQELIPIIQEGQTFESISGRFRVESISRQKDILTFNGDDDLLELLDKDKFPINLNQKFKLKKPTKTKYEVYYIKLSEASEEIKCRIINNCEVELSYDGTISSLNEINLPLYNFVLYYNGNTYFYGKLINREEIELTEDEYLKLPTIQPVLQH